MDKSLAKNKWVALSLCVCLGYLGAHKFYEGKNKIGVIYLLTLGLLGIGWIIDIIILVLKPNPYYASEKDEEIEKKDLKLLSGGYKKVHNDLYVNDKEKVLIINNNKYSFSQIIDCELVQNNSTINSTLGNTKGKIKNNGKIKARTNTLSAETNYCNELYLNITVDDLYNPNIKLNVRGVGVLNTNGEKYKNVINKANEMLSLFKLIISKNNVSYVDNGTITKIEHKYVEEESNIQKLEELSRLHKNGALKDYEYSIKKQELLENIKK